MRKNYFFFKSLLLATVLMLGSANAWAAGYTRTLTDKLEVTGYKAKAFYDFQNNSPAVLPTSGDLCYRSGGIWGLHNFKAGTRSATATIPVAATDILIIQEYSSSYVTTINRGSENATLTASTGYRVFNITSTADDVTFTVPRYGGIVAAFVMEIDESAETANYTINYKKGGDIIKTVSGEDIAIGTVISIESTFFKDDVKYITDGGQISSFKIVEGDNVHDISVSVAPTYNYTVNATDGTNILKVLASGSVYSGESVAVSFPRYFNIDGTLYEKGAISSQYVQNVVVSTNDQVTNFVYTATGFTNVVYHSEGEDITGATATSEGNNMKARSSNQQCGYTTSDLTLINLPAGSYRLKCVVYSNSSGGATISFQLGGDTYNAIVSGSSNWSEFSQDFTLETAADVKWLTSGDSKNGLDFVYIQKTAEIFTISSSTGLATLYTSCPLDFANATPADELKAYTVTVSLAEDEVTPTQVDNVPAQTGVILKGVEGHTYTIPVLASSSTAKGALIGSTTPTAPGAFLPEYDLYGLAATLSGEAEFRKVVGENAIPAGRAFLKLTHTNEAKVLRVVDGQTTEVVAPEVVETEEPEVLYNMAGIPVGKDFKGYVINQKGEKRLQR